MTLNMEPNHLSTLGSSRVQPARKRHSRLLLISCYELGHQPLSIALPLAFLQRAGHAADCMDLATEGFEAHKASRARFVGISAPMHTALRLGVRAAEKIRRINPSCHICFYGLYASLNADYLLAHVADSLIAGEYETPLVALVRAFEEGRSLAVDGVRLRGRRADPVLNRQSFPVPSRSMLPPLERYTHLERNGGREQVGYVEASRGCRHYCLHCPIPPVYKGRFFIVPRANILEDIRSLVGSGATHITFGDPDFLNGPGHSLGIVRDLHKEFPSLTFDITTKVEHILKHRSIFKELGHLGCAFVVSAIESLSDTVLMSLEKGHTRVDIFATLAILRGAKIPLRPTLLPFTPWTSLDDYIDLLEFVAVEGLIDHVDPVQYTIRLLIPPRSDLLTRKAIHRFLGPLDPANFEYTWTHPDPRMDRLHQAARAVVEKGTEVEEDPVVTFGRLRELAYAARGDRKPAAGRMELPRSRKRPPRLTEAWFC